MKSDCKKASEEQDFATFVTTLGDSNYSITLKIPITFPCSEIPAELAHRIIQHHNLPIFVHEELSDQLANFFQSAANKISQKQGLSLMHKVRNKEIDLEQVIRFWEHQDYEDSCQVTGDCEEELPVLYHDLVHSESGSKLLILEHQYSSEVATLVDKRDDCLVELEQKQSAEVGAIMSRGCPDHQVNDITARHLEAADLARAEWDSAISVLKEQQLRNFRTMLRDGQVAGSLDAIASIGDMGDSAPVMEESFTIHLGTQMKQMHNLRLIAADAMDLCAYSNAVLHSDELPPQRIQTSMQLYGRNLHGLVIMVDDRINSYSGIKKEFGRVCSRATELHFQELCDQLEGIREYLVPEVCHWRARRAGGRAVAKNDSNDESLIDSSSQHLQPGDVYITKHSNLSTVHVVFHVVCDDTLRNCNINSRHPVILGIRNVLKVACLCDITTLSLPLLLSNSLSEDMSVPWCQRRAELVYKCVKGFMMEMTSWGGSEMNTLQFMLPKNISEEQFQSLAAMLPSIFRVSNPLVVSSQQGSVDSEGM